MAEISRKSSAHVDRGWAWMVCIAGHFCFALTIGYATSLGVLFIEWKEHFDLSATTSSWVVGIPLLVAGPVSVFMGAIALRLGIRRVSLLGSVVTGLATILGSFSTDVWHLYLSAAISGIGLVLVVSPALVILSQYFRKRFALANGLFILGISTGQTVFPPVSRLLIENYGWRGAMLIIGAIQINSVAACALFRPLKASSDNVRRGRFEGLDDEGAVDMDIETTVSGTLRNTTQEMQTLDQTRETTHTENEQLNVQESVPTRLDKYVSPENENLVGEVSRQVNRTIAVSNQSCPEETYHGRRQFRDRFGFLDVFSNTLVVLIIFASCFFAIGLSTNIIHLPARVKGAGWSEDQGALVLSIYAIVSIVTRATHGWFVDRNYIGAFKLQSIVFLGCAIVTFMNPVSDSYIYLIADGALLGALAGIAAPLTFFTARSVARPSQVPTTMSLILAAHFLFSGTGPVIAGKIYDATGNYVTPFLAAGAMLFAAFTLTVIAAVCKRRRQVE